jgi:hypothetical protein
MNIEEKIITQVHELPDTKKAEVLEFVNYLMTKNNNKDWTDFSLSSAMRCMEREDPSYSFDDIKE